MDESFNYGATVFNNNSGAGGFSLQQNFPNPVQRTTSINFNLPQNVHVLVEVLNDKGNVIDILVNSHLSGWSYSIFWDSSNSPSGLYFCRI